MKTARLLCLAWAALELGACHSVAPAPALADPGTPPVPAPATEPASQRPEPWYEREIRAFEEADRAHPPRPGQVLFVGSSSIRLWEGLEQDMGLPVLQRGFGGSKTGDVLAVAERIVFPYRPSTIVYYCGDNDLGTDGHDATAAAGGFIELAERARSRLPGVRILYLSIKPSPARWSNWASMAEANAIVRRYAESTDGVEFLDLGPCLLGGDGRPDPALFRDDGLHLNRAGYARWAAIVRPRLAGSR